MNKLTLDELEIDDTPLCFYIKSHEDVFVTTENALKVEKFDEDEDDDDDENNEEDDDEYD